jgi:hypothetical protein
VRRELALPVAAFRRPRAYALCVHRGYPRAHLWRRMLASRGMGLDRGEAEAQCGGIARLRQDRWSRRCAALALAHPETSGRLRVARSLFPARVESEYPEQGGMLA